MDQNVLTLAVISAAGAETEERAEKTAPLLRGRPNQRSVKLVTEAAIDPILQRAVVTRLVMMLR